MAKNDYKVILGVELNQSQLKSVEQSIDNLVKKNRDINIDVDFNIKGADKLVEVGKKINNLKDQTTSKNKIDIPINAKGIEESLNKILKAIEKIGNAFGTVDKKNGMTNLLDNINMIEEHLNKTQKEIKELSGSLKSLGNQKLDFNIDLGFAGGKKTPEQMIKEINLLEKELKEYQKYAYTELYSKEYDKTGKVDERKARDSIYELMSRAKKQSQYGGYVQGLESKMVTSTTPDATKIAAYKEYIKAYKELLSLNKFSPEIVESRMANSDDFIKVKNEASEAEKKIKELFGSGIDGGELQKTLNGISEDLSKIQQSISKISEGTSIDKITQSFKEMSEVLEVLTANFRLIQSNVGNLGNGLSGGISGATQGLKDDTAILDRFKQSLSNIGMGQDEIDAVANRIKSLGVQIEVLDQKKKRIKGSGKNGENKEFLSVDISGVDKFGNVVKLTERYNLKTGELIESLDGVSSAQQKAGTSANTFANKQKKAVSDLTNQINQINRAAIDPNASRPIKDSSHLGELSGKYNEITNAIKNMGNASSEIFVDEQNHVKKLISEFKSLVSEFKNAENVSSKMKGTDFKSGLGIAKNDLEKFKSDAKDYPQLVNTIKDLDEAIAKVGDSSSLNKFTDQLRVARSELAKVKSETTAANRSERVGIKTSGLQSQINELKKISPEIDKFKTKINGTEVTIESLTNELGKVKTQGDFSVVSAKFKAFTDAAKAAGISVGETAEKVKLLEKIADKLKFSDKGISGFDTEISSINEKYSKLSVTTNALKNDMQSLDNAFDMVKMADEANDTEKLIAAYKEYEEILKRVKNQIEINSREERKANNNENLEIDRERALLKLKTMFDENSEAARKLASEIERIQKELNECGSVDGVRRLEKEITNLGLKAKEAGYKTQSLSQQFKKEFSKYSTYFSAASVFMYVEQGLRSMFQQVVAIDTAMTELKKVTDETGATYNQFLTNAGQRAAEIGTTVDGLVTSTADFARLGYNFTDAAGLAEVANIYTVVGDEIDSVDTATQSLISTMKAFKNEAVNVSESDFAIGIVDKMNEVSNNFAISSGGIGEALTRSASSLAAANNTLDESIALITASNSVVQDPTVVGTALKTISMRIRGAKTEMEDAGLETEGMAESTAKLREEIMALSDVDIMLDKNTFKSTYQIMEELAAKWEDLTDIQQASITELIAGKRQGNIVASLMTNFDVAQDALKTSLNSEGSAMTEHEKWMQSLEAKINQLKAAWQGLSQAFMSSDFLKASLDILIKFVETLTKLVDTFGTLGTLGIGAGIFSMFKLKGSGAKSGILGDLSAFGSLATEAMSSSDALGKKFKNLGTVAGEAGGSITKRLTGSLAGTVGAIGIGVAAIGLLINAYENYKEKQAEARRETIETSDTFLDSANSFEQAYVKYSGKSDLTVDEELELETAVQGTVDALNDKSSALQGVVDGSGSYIASLEQIAAQEIKTANDIAKAKKQAAEGDLEASAYDSIYGSKVKVRLGLTDDDKVYQIAKDVGSEYFNNINRNSKAFELKANASADEVLDYYYTLKEYQKELLDSGLEDTTAYDNTTKAINKMEDAINTYVDSVVDAAKAQYQLDNGIPTTAEEYLKMREAILNSEDIKNSGIEARREIASALDSEYGQIFDLTDIEIQARQLIGVLDEFGEQEAKQIEPFLNLKTKVNNNECSVGEYISELERIENLTKDWSEESKAEFNSTFGIDTDGIKEQYDNLYNNLKDSIGENNAKSFIDELNSSELAVTIDFINSKDVTANDALQNYKDILKEAEEAGVDFSKTTYGNIDTNARKTLEWTSENLKKYKDELMSWESEDASWNDVKKDFEGTISTVMGRAETFTIDGQKVDIAFSPMLQTESGAEVLSRDTVNTYIGNIIEKATEDGKWTDEELFKLDAKGVEVDGRKIKGILADIGISAISTSEQMHFVGKDGAAALAKEYYMSLIEEQAKINEAMTFTPNISVDKESIEAFNEVVAESASATGLSSESIDTLIDKYSELEGYDFSTLFEKTGNGIKVNREELAKLNKEQQEATKEKTEEHIDTLVDKYNDLTEEIDNCSNASERANLIREREGYGDKIQELAEYKAQLEAATGAYQRWIDAQQAPQNYEGYQAVATSREGVKDEISRGFISDATKEYIDLLSGEDLVGGTIDDYANAWKRLDKAVGSTSYDIHDFFTVNDDGDITATGIDRFFEGIKQDFKGSVAKFDEETGKWQYDFSEENLEKIQDEWGIGIEAIQLLLEAAADAGYNVDWGGILDDIDIDTADFETLVSIAEDAQNEFNKLNDEMDGIEDVKFNFTATDVEEATGEIEKAQEAYLELITNDDGSINLEAKGASQMRDMLAVLLVQKQQLEDSDIVMGIDTTGLEKSQADIGTVINTVIEFRNKYKNFEIAVSTGEGIEEAKDELSSAMTDLKNLGDEGVNIAAQLMLGEGSTANALESQISEALTYVDSDIEVGTKLDETSVGNLNSQLKANFTPEATVKITKIDESLISGYSSTEKTANGKVKWTNDESLVIKFQNETHKAKGEVEWDDNTDKLKTSGYTATGRVTWTSGNNVKVKVVTATGTAKSNGSALLEGSASGRAFARGNWGIKGSGTALGGELGREIVVRDGKFFTIGDQGAEFFQYKPNDIVFNAAQTESLFKYGGIKGAKPRGTMLATGSAFANGSYPSSGSAFWEATASESDFASNRNGSSSSSSRSSSSSTSSKSKTKTKTKTKKYKKSDYDKEVFDWIEIKIQRLEEALDSLGRKAESVYNTWYTRNRNLGKEITKTKDMITLQEKAAQRYLTEANKVSLDSKWKKKVQNGTVDISLIKNEKLAERIKKYQEWYEKYKQCKIAAEEYKEELKELYSQRFDNALSEFDAKLTEIESNSSILEERISQAELKGQIVNTAYYEALSAQKRNEIKTLENERAKLIALRDEAVASGVVTKYSEEWYRMNEEIDACTRSIEEGETALLEYAEAMREIEWNTFDSRVEEIQKLNDEADFLIDLMSRKDMYDDDGNLTDEGMATIGLHAQNHNTYMEQAQKYEDEIASLDAEYADDFTNQDYIKRRQELVEAQRQAILSAEDEKEAIRDLVEEGIEAELDAMQERIDKYEESLDAAKDLYEYNKKVKNQTKEIANLEKQLAAYQGDDSEEAKAKVQKIKLELEEAKEELKETEYDKYISDQKELLDDLYTQYEDILNTRLDNIEQLFEDMIVQSNDNASKIAQTINAVAGAMGYETSDAINAIWSSDSSTPPVTTYENGSPTSESGTSDASQDAYNSISQGEADTELPDDSNPRQNDGKIDLYDKVKLKKGTAYYSTSSEKTSKGKSSYKGTTKKDVWYYITGISNSNPRPYRLSKTADRSTGDLGWVRLRGNKDANGNRRYNFTGYATGAKEILENETAWTQEKGREYIVRPSDGAILTPLAKGDSVLNANASNNIWNIANNPTEFIKDNLELGIGNIPNNANVQNNLTQNFDKVIFSMPNVQSYNELLTEMQRDKNFEKLILSMSVDRIAGKTSLAKGKIIR